jgi:hypothetical protein
MMQIQKTRGLCGRRRSGVYRFTLSVICMLGVHFQIAWADPSQCEFAGQKQMLMVQLFMGLNPPREGSVMRRPGTRFSAQLSRQDFQMD